MTFKHFHVSSKTTSSWFSNLINIVMWLLTIIHKYCHPIALTGKSINWKVLIQKCVHEFDVNTTSYIMYDVIFCVLWLLYKAQCISMVVTQNGYCVYHNMGQKTCCLIQANAKCCLSFCSDGASLTSVCGFIHWLVGLLVGWLIGWLASSVKQSAKLQRQTCYPHTQKKHTPSKHLESTVTLIYFRKVCIFFLASLVRVIPLVCL